MKRSISQRIYRWGLVPLALLSIVLIVWNGLARLQDAKQELKNAQLLTATLLHAPAVDALVVGNTLTFDQLVKDLVTTSPTLICVSLHDLSGYIVSEAGHCEVSARDGDTFAVETISGSLSDYGSSATTPTRVGVLRISMSQRGLVERTQQLILQLLFSIAMVVIVVAAVVRVLRARLIRPIQDIAAAMKEVSQRNYAITLKSNDDDEIGRLGGDVTKTIETIADYMKELERRRSDADRALHEADEAALAKDGLIRALSDDLAGPLSGMYAEMTALAIANKDSALRERIKSVMGLLDEAQSNFDDLMEVSTNSQTQRREFLQDFSDVLNELQRSVGMLAGAAGKPLQFDVKTPPFQDIQTLHINLDGIRFRKAVSYLLRAMFEHCSARGIEAQLDTIKLTDDTLHLSVQLKAFYETPPNTPRTAVVSLMPNTKAPPAALRWSERDKKIIEYLLRAANVAVRYSVLPSGLVFVHLETVVRYNAGIAPAETMPDWMTEAAPIASTIISDDVQMLRYTMRGYLSRHDVKLLPFAAALKSVSNLLPEDMLVIDCSSHIAEVFLLLQKLNEDGGRVPSLIAICPQGEISTALEDRLLQFGFKAVLQKPVQPSRLMETIQTVVTEARARSDA